MGETLQARRLSHAAGRRSAGRLAEGSSLSLLLSAVARDERGATAIEYCVLIAFLGSVIVASLSVFQEGLYDLINSMAGSIFNAGS